MKDWQKMFEPIILERGQKYCIDGLVEKVERTNERICAVVNGSQDYNVTVEITEDGNFVNYSCDCPHFEDGHNCKHIAAVLFKLEEFGLNGAEELADWD